MNNITDYFEYDRECYLLTHADTTYVQFAWRGKVLPSEIKCSEPDFPFVVKFAVSSNLQFNIFDVLSEEFILKHVDTNINPQYLQGTDWSTKPMSLYYSYYMIDYRNKIGKIEVGTQVERLRDWYTSESLFDDGAAVIRDTINYEDYLKVINNPANYGFKNPESIFNAVASIDLKDISDTFKPMSKLEYFVSSLTEYTADWRTAVIKEDRIIHIVFDSTNLSTLHDSESLATGSSYYDFKAMFASTQLGLDLCNCQWLPVVEGHINMYGLEYKGAVIYFFDTPNFVDYCRVANELGLETAAVFLDYPINTTAVCLQGCKNVFMYAYPRTMNE